MSSLLNREDTPNSIWAQNWVLLTTQFSNRAWQKSTWPLVFHKISTPTLSMYLMVHLYWSDAGQFWLIQQAWDRIDWSLWCHTTTPHMCANVINNQETITLAHYSTARFCFWLFGIRGMHHFIIIEKNKSA